MQLRLSFWLINNCLESCSIFTSAAAFQRRWSLTLRFLTHPWNKFYARMLQMLLREMFVLIWTRRLGISKVDKAEPHWNDERSDVKPLHRRIIGQSWSPGGGSSAAGEGGSVVGICGDGLWCWLVGDTRKPQWCFRDFRLSNVDR